MHFGTTNFSSCITVLSVAVFPLWYYFHLFIGSCKFHNLPLKINESVQPLGTNDFATMQHYNHNNYQLYLPINVTRAYKIKKNKQ